MSKQDQKQQLKDKSSRFSLKTLKIHLKTVLAPLANGVTTVDAAQVSREPKQVFFKSHNFIFIFGTLA